MNPPIRPLVEIELTNLRAHPHNSNVMPDRLFEKLVGQLQRTTRCPPLIVRPMPGEPGAYQVLDGHHRWRALERIGRLRAPCLVWDVDDAEALLLLATLNRLEGADEPHARARLIAELQAADDRSAAELAQVLPEAASDVKKLLELNAPPPLPQPPPQLESMRVAMHFFVLPQQKRRIDAALAAVGGDRGEALLQLIEHAGVSDGA